MVNESFSFVFRKWIVRRLLVREVRPLAGVSLPLQRPQVSPDLGFYAPPIKRLFRAQQDPLGE